MDLVGNSCDRKLYWSFHHVMLVAVADMSLLKLKLEKLMDDKFLHSSFAFPFRGMARFCCVNDGSKVP